MTAIRPRPGREPLAQAVWWALRSRTRRKAGEHTVPDSELAHAFAGEWGLDAQDRARLMLALLHAEQREAA